VPADADLCLAGDAWALLRSSGSARRAGAVYTPPDVARRVVDLALARLGAIPSSVWDPAVGGGVFLVAAADALVAAGVDPDDALARLWGTDRDPVAIALAEAALLTWARAIGATTAPHLHEGDAFAAAVPDVDLVVGNPPFLAQLSAATTRSPSEQDAAAALLGSAAGYADAAGLFLVLAVERLAPGGVAALVQPQSLLAARDAAPVRQRVTARAALHALWVIDVPLFAAAVHTCVLVLRAQVDPHTTTSLHAGRSGAKTGSAPCPTGDAPWSSLLAEARGVPPARGGGPRVLGDLADITADFRDAFYEVAAGVREAGDVDPDPSTGSAAVVPVGLIDVAASRWGTRPARIGGRDWERPVVDLAGLGPWAKRRLVPKVLVATQTKVVEAVADLEGVMLPLTPVVTVAPDRDRCGHVLAALLDPWATAWLLRQASGTARSPDRLKVSAGLLRQLPIPDESEEWDEAAGSLARQGIDGVELAARLMLCARGVDPPEADLLMAWWSARSPTVQ
jgi:hypothetical protein